MSGVEFTGRLPASVDACVPDDQFLLIVQHLGVLFEFLPELLICRGHVRWRLWRSLAAQKSLLQLAVNPQPICSFLGILRYLWDGESLCGDPTFGHAALCPKHRPGKGDREH